MKWWESALHIIAISFMHYGYIKAYSKIFKKEKYFKEFIIGIILLFITILTYYNTFYNSGVLKIIISFSELLVLFKIIFKESWKITILRTLIMYVFIVATEMILGIFIVYFNIESLVEFNYNVVFKVLFSILMTLVLMLLSNLKFINKLFNKLYILMEKIFNLTVLTIISVIILVMLTYYLIISNGIYSNLSIICLIVILAVLIIIAMVESIKTKQANDKQEVLLGFMKEYEMIIDKERIDRHEMVNNLLILKTFKNKNSKDFERILDGLLLTYQNNKTPKGLYELPSGLKGLFYYKIYDMKNSNIETFINISNKIIKDLDNLDSKILTKVCKILGILLDNAKEAAKESNKKLVVIDLYKEKNNTVVYIENSINRNNKLDLSKMKVKGFSTKGNNRGYGLYLVDRILNKTDKLELFQEINKNKFVSILKIENN